FAAGGASISYQWRFEGVDISGATSSNLLIAGVTPADFGSYECTLTNMCGSTTSLSAMLSESAPTAITAQPVGVMGCIGAPFSLSVGATGTGVLEYQWRLDGVDIAGANAATYTVDFATTGDNGSYDCIVTGDCTSVLSDAVTVTVELCGELIRRGDANSDGVVNVADAIFIINWQFLSGPQLCLKAMDSNDDGLVNVADVVFLIVWAFQGGAEPPAPFSACGIDPTLDSLSCDAYTGCP
ncbi:MAG: hypothetical protein KDC38_15755, partial [Planctomycetes bacterium]|nr:hypothetical protein [Planctomycetota bacterium]